MHIAAYKAASTAILAYATRNKVGVEEFRLDYLEGLERHKEILPCI